MNKIISDFWEWLNMTPDQYAQNGIDTLTNTEESDYPHFEDLINYAQTIIDQIECSDEELEDVLLIMALDNEDEDVLDYIQTHCSESRLERLIRLGISYYQPEARWQIALLICRRKISNAKELLELLSHDIHPYVRRRALNCLNSMLL